MQCQYILLHAVYCRCCKISPLIKAMTLPVCRIVSTGQTETGRQSSWSTGWLDKTSTPWLKTSMTPTTLWSSTSSDSRKVRAQYVWAMSVHVSSHSFLPTLWLRELSRISVTNPQQVPVISGTWINDGEACERGRAIKASGAAVHSHICQSPASKPVFSYRTIQIWIERNWALNHKCDGCARLRVSFSACQFPYLTLPACLFLFLLSSASSRLLIF